MIVSGNIDKMETRLTDTVEYRLPIGEERVLMNEFLGKPIRMLYEHVINCTVCGRKTNKSFAQGLCYPCFVSSPENAECIIRPELCRGHLGEGRDPQWELDHHVKPHYVYLAASSDIKVGVTRNTQVPTRWIDQGADAAILFAETPNRYLAGVIEVAMKNFLTDKTDWRKMLKGETTQRNLMEVKHELLDKLSDELKPYFVADDSITHIKYPVLSFPEKVSSVGFEKEEIIEGELKGIKAQYLIFKDNRVINIRAHGGYKITLEA